MAEQFIVLNATTKLVRNFVKTIKCTITVLYHTNVPWNLASRAQYDGMMGLNGAAAIINRNGLPPHFYIEIPATTNVPTTGDTDLIRKLSRTVVPVILKGLDAGTVPLWNEGRTFEALNNELKKGPVSMSLFHFNGAEVTAADRETVNGFPKKV